MVVDETSGDWVEVGEPFCNCQFATDDECSNAVEERTGDDSTDTGEWEDSTLSEEDCWAAGGRYDLPLDKDGNKDYTEEFSCWLNEWSWCKSVDGYRDAETVVDETTGDWVEVGEPFCNC